MAAGLPVVLPAAGGVLSYAEPDNAWIAAPTARGFAEIVKQAFSQPDLRQAKAVRARAKAEDLAWPRVAARFFELFDQIAKSERPR
jgi:glycosyltransferase involved in cell wall biosynthesis